MKLSERQRQFAHDLGVWISWVYENGYEITLGEVFRTEEQQKWYVQKGLSKTMNSRHRQKLALDFNLFVGGTYTSDIEKYRPLGEAWESLGEGHVWGGRWASLRDAGHIELVP